jgi:hypothetical protein
VICSPAGSGQSKTNETTAVDSHCSERRARVRAKSLTLLINGKIVTGGAAFSVFVREGKIAAVGRRQCSVSLEVACI